MVMGRGALCVVLDCGISNNNPFLKYPLVRVGIKEPPIAWWYVPIAFQKWKTQVKR